MTYPKELYYNGVVIPITYMTPYIDCSTFTNLRIIAFSNADFNISLNWSMDYGINTDYVTNSNVNIAGSTYVHSSPIRAKFVSILYEDDSGVGGRILRLQTSLNVNDVGISSLVNLGTGVKLLEQNSIEGIKSIKSIDNSVSLASSSSTEIDLSVTGTNITLADAPLGLGDSLINDGIGPNLKIKTLNVGYGIGFNPSANDIQIINTLPSTDVNIGSAPASVGISLINWGVGPGLKTKGIKSGTGISLANDGNDITVSNTVVLPVRSYGDLLKSSSLVNQNLTPVYTLWNSGTFSSGLLSNFTRSVSRLTYTGAETAIFIIMYAANDPDLDTVVVDLAIFKNGVIDSGSVSTFRNDPGGGTSNGTSMNVSSHSVMSLSTNDYVELYAKVSSAIGISFREMRLSAVKIA